MGDAFGLVRGKRIPASNWQNICENGSALCISLLTLDMTCDIWDVPVANFGNGFPDMHMFPITTPVAVPWEPGVAVVFGRAEGKDRKPLSTDPRNVLIRQLERAQNMGITVNVGTELEFYLLDPNTGLPRDEGIQVYGLSRAARMEHIVGPIRQQVNQCGIPIEQSNPEFAPGQVEVNIRYAEALLAADCVVLFKSLVRQLGIMHDYLTTFMPKPFFEESGSGFHTHYSFWKDGKNIFASDGRINCTAKAFIAGL